MEGCRKNGGPKLFLAGLLLAAAGILIPRWCGLKAMAVVSGSMEPKIPVGSMVYVKPVSAAGLRPGDVCTYRLQTEPTLVTHRVVQVDGVHQTLLTKGDANDRPDPVVNFEQVVGQVKFHLPGAGWWVLGLRTPLGMLFLCLGTIWAVRKLTYIIE